MSQQQLESNLPTLSRRIVAVASRQTVIITISLGIGALTDLAQMWLPRWIGSLANSSGSWVLAAFLLAITARSHSEAALRGAIALVGLVAGYYIAAGEREVPISVEQIAFWAITAVAVGPIVGLAASCARRGTPPLAATGAGALAGILIGEGIYGLTALAVTTSPVYWWAEILVATLVFGFVAILRIPLTATRILGVVSAAVVASVMTDVYRH